MCQFSYSYWGGPALSPASHCQHKRCKHAERHRCRGFHISRDLQLLIDSGDTDALAALSDHTADTDGWDDEFLPGYASGASDDGDLFKY